MAKGEIAQVIGASVIEAKKAHVTMWSIAGVGVTTGEIVGYCLAGLAAASSMYVIYSTFLKNRVSKLEERKLELEITRLERDEKKDPL